MMSLTIVQIEMEVKRTPHKTTILYIGPSMSFHADLAERNVILAYLALVSDGRGWLE